MKKILFLALLLAALPLQAAQQPTQQKPDFKMIIRLWPKHHEDPQTSQELLDAFRKYPHFCDEVWFCTAEPMIGPLEQHRQSARQMGEMADKLRKMGITPSLQFISVGHPESGASATLDPNIHWGTMVGPGGEQTFHQSCPRQQAFLDHMEQAMALYAKEVQPYGAWIDDDLRITSHTPAQAICYCDDCIRQFNQQYGYSFDRAGLVDAMALNRDAGQLRGQWIRFCQEGLACVAAASARGVHSTSPQTHMGLQHVNFHRFFLEGYDWNPIFDAFERETGLTPLSRPGNGNYDDHAPRGMFEKGLDLARQIRRLNPDITEIAPEIEGYLHMSSGKSAHGVCIETMYYLSMGATQMSYALICSASEPMTWYADHYFKHLQRWHEFARQYADWNWGTQPGGIDPYISPGMYRTGESPSADALTWTTTSTGTQIYALAPLGIPFCPDGDYPVALMMDVPGLSRMTDAEIAEQQARQNFILDQAAYDHLQSRGLTQGWQSVHPDEELIQDFPCYQMPGGNRAVVVRYDISSLGISGHERLQRMHAMDWASQNRMPAIIESTAQAALIPRVDSNQNLRSVAILNCSITEEDSYTLRLRLGPNQQVKRFVWKKNGQKDVRLKPRYEGHDVLLEVPMLEGWNFGWIAVEPIQR